MNRKYRKRRKNSKGIIVVIIAIVIIGIIIFGINKMTSKEYIDKIGEVLESDSTKTMCTVSNTSTVNTKVYSGKGVKYTNQHENIVRLGKYDSSDKSNTEKILKIRTLFNNIKKLEKGETLKELPAKENGYYWIRIIVTVEEKYLFIKSEKTYSLDMYYDKEKGNVYIKNKYYDDFSKKNNKVKLDEYKVDEVYQKLLEDVIISKTE